MFYQAHVFEYVLFIYYLFFRTLSEKTTKPIIAKLEHNMYA